MTTFSRYYDQNGLLQETTMDEMEELIKDEKNKGQIADLIYHRYYERYLKIFDFEDTNTKEYDNRHGDKKTRSVFNMEYKNGFAMMVNCCLLIETLASFFKGTDKTMHGGVNAYEKVFERAKLFYNNDLGIFLEEPIYGVIRCALLHQGETYDGFKIRRDGISLFDKSTNTIDATKFCYWINKLLESYRDELSNPNTNWDDILWKNCKDKLKFIVKNTIPKS